ncbi:RNase adapter RapZ [Ostreiculturibacter nitratireducens]|uniref:RNase adapter RapZ n=1 Tax=Ostreiculturibacter nitratireducens TaxID=3075226 RepID=UPI0031B5E84C
MNKAEEQQSDSQAVQRVVLVTGPSGSGRSTAIDALEDLGYEPIDNLPLSLVPRLLEGPPINCPMALGIDVRNREFSTGGMIELIDYLTRIPSVIPEVLFLDCSNSELRRRYGETRRRHPLAKAEDPDAAIAQEIDILAPIKARADVLIDTSELSPHDLKAEIARWFAQADEARLSISVQSFSYKRGAPRGLDLMFDCRFLRNPHWEPALRALDGRDPVAAAYVEADPRYAAFCDKILDLLALLLPAQLEEGKSHLAVGFGCTGGQHRSVTIAEKVAKALAEAGWQVSKRHRELERRAEGPATEKAG